MIKPLKIKEQLAPAPQNPPLYSLKIKNKNGKEVLLGDPAMTRGLLALMNQHAVNNGAACHWGGSSAFAEIMSAVHGLLFTHKKWYENFHFVNDAGHTENGLYALRANLGFNDLTFKDLESFRSISSVLTGHGESSVNPRAVSISNGPLGSALAQAQGLSLADKILKNSRITICTLSDGGSMEGEAKEALTAIPALADKDKLNPFLLIISDNNTKLSGRISEDTFSLQPSFCALETLGWKVIKIEDGHDLQKIYRTLEEALEILKNSSKKPLCLHIKTIKGKGVKSSERNSSGGHGFPLKAFDQKLRAFLDEIFHRQIPPIIEKSLKHLEGLSPKEKMITPTPIHEKVQVGFSQAAIELTEEGFPLYSLSSDLQGSTGILGFHKKFPRRYIDLGIAESNMIGAAIGFSKVGFIPIVDTFAQFGITKGNLPLIMSALSEAPLIALFSHTGFQDAADGSSHQATTYMGAIAGIPNTLIINCSCSREASSYFKLAVQNIKKYRESQRVHPSVIFFFGRESHPQYYIEDQSYKWLQPQLLVSGRDGIICTTGAMVASAFDTVKALNKRGIFPSLVNSPFANHPAVPFFKDLLLKNKSKILTVEDHQKIGGMGQMLFADLLDKEIVFQGKILGIDGRFGRSAYTASDLYSLHKIDCRAQVVAFLDLFKRSV